MKSLNENLGERCSVHKMHDIIETLKKKAMNSDLQYKHSACLVHKNKIISIGFNKYINIGISKIVNSKATNLNTKTTDYKSSLHAEIDAILQRDTRTIRGLDIIIIRVKELANGNIILKNSRPCNSCIDKMRSYGIRKVYYSNDIGEIVYEFLETMPKLHISSGTVLKKYITTISTNQTNHDSEDIEKELNKLKTIIRCC